MSPEPGFFNEVSQNPPAEVKEWKDSEILGFGQFKAVVTLPDGKQLFGILTPYGNDAGGSLSIPLKEDSPAPRPTPNPEIERARMAIKNLDLISTFPSGDNIINQTYYAIGLKPQGKYAGYYGQIQCQSYSGKKDDGILYGLLILIDPVEHPGQLINPPEQIALGVAKDFSDALPGWKLEPAK